MPEINTPFWEQEPIADDTAALVPADIPVRPGGESGIDPDTGTWRPVQHGEPFTTNGHEYRWSEGPIAVANFLDKDGNELGSVHIPFDPDTQQPGDDDMLKEAEHFFLSLEHLREGIRPEAIADLEPALHRSVSEGEGVADIMIAIVAGALEGSLKVTVTDDDNDGLSPEQLAALATEGERLFDSKLPDMVRSIADTPDGEGLTFWAKLAREIIATATLYARDTVAERMGGFDVVEALNDDDWEKFEDQVNEEYRTGPYLGAASLSLTHSWTDSLGELVATVMKDAIADSESDTSKFLSEKLIKEARKALGFPVASEPAAVTPAFTADGYAHIHNSLIPNGSRLALVAKWSGAKTAHPEFHFHSGGGRAIYAPSESIYPLAADAWRVVDALDDAHADTLDYILAKALANQRDEYGLFRLTREEVLDARGIQKATSRGHKPENLTEIASHIEHLSQLMVRAIVTGYTKSTNGRRGKQETLTIEAPLILIDETLYRTTVDGQKTPIAWNLRPGGWSRDMDRFTPQLATMMQGILKLHAKNDAHAKRIGRYLVSQYRIRAYEKSWAQPHRIKNLLSGAGIEADRKNPKRFRERIEAALDTLSNPVAMGDGPVCIEQWKYTQPVEAKGRGWFDCWLESGIIIAPPAPITEEYSKIGAKVRQPRKLATKSA